jgi:spectinomycin phosphotransferase
MLKGQITMLERPSLTDETIAACLYHHYGLTITEITFLPLGADQNTAVFRALNVDNTPYFIKLRSGNFDRITVDVPKYLFDQGIRSIIAPISSHSDDLSVRLDDYNLILYPFIEGQGGFDKPLSDHDWTVFGRALKSIHAVTLPPELAARIPHESYSPRWREQARQFQSLVAEHTFTDPIATSLATFMQNRHAQINHLIQRSEDLCVLAQRQPANHILCHADIHVGNVLLSTNGDLYIVDWDDPILAPKERDLMFIGGGIGGGGHTADQEESLFYAGYGQTSIDPILLAYYRYERIVIDLVVYCQQLLLTDEGGDDRPEGLRQITGQFGPGDVIDMAYRTERLLPPALQSPWPS